VCHSDVGETRAARQPYLDATSERYSGDGRTFGVTHCAVVGGRSHGFRTGIASRSFTCGSVGGGEQRERWPVDRPRRIRRGTSRLASPTRTREEHKNKCHKIRINKNENKIIKTNIIRVFALRNGIVKKREQSGDKVPYRHNIYATRTC